MMNKGEIKVIKNNPLQKGLATYVPDVVYSAPEKGVELKLHLLLPRETMLDTCEKKFPCIVFLQGSAWTSPDISYALPQLADFAREGFVVASVIHRSALDGYPVPDFLIDYKCAIRFLRAHADVYRIDRDRIGAWGTSSGGNTALLAALTSNDAKYKSREWEAESDAVKACAACFPPTDIPLLYKTWTAGSGENVQENYELIKAMVGSDESVWEERMKEISPLYRIKQGQDYPPFLLLHGDADKLVSFEQSEKMYSALRGAGAKCDFVRVEGADHEGDFWSMEVLDAIKEFFLYAL